MLDEEAKRELQQACEPVILWLRKHSDPHTLVMVTYARTDVFEGKFGFVRDVE